jgi:hypothetical protein
VGQPVSALTEVVTLLTLGFAFGLRGSRIRRAESPALVRVAEATADSNCQPSNHPGP